MTGQEVIVIGNDFIKEDQAATIVTVAEDGKTALLLLDEPLEHAGKTYRHVVASPRLVKDDFCTLASAGRLGCNVTWIPNEQYDPSRPMDLRWWRGDAAAITDLQIR
ncbi:hypothetical protein [Pelagibius sp. 7325]|uniref:hypothetical protein n=1 Tax=Pelagibius sp. 7325 TaxID=3131994 RepID=UPI0030EF8F43